MDNLHQDLRQGPTHLEVGHENVNDIEVQTYEGLIERSVGPLKVTNSLLAT